MTPLLEAVLSKVSHSRVAAAPCMLPSDIGIEAQTQATA
jgi:hypothetical protein